MDGVRDRYMIYKIRYDEGTGEIISKEEILYEDEQSSSVLYTKEKPKGWYVDLKTGEVLSKPTTINVGNHFNFHKPFSLSDIPLPSYQENLNGKKELAIVRLIGIGDIVMTLPLVDVLREEFPEYYITYWTSKVGSRILKENNSVDCVKVLDYRTPTQSMPPLPSEVTDYDIAINLINKFDFGSITWTRPRIDNIFLSANNQLVEYIKHPIQAPKDYTMPDLFISDEQRKFSMDTLSNYNLLSTKVIGCILSSHGDCRFWKLNRWIELAERMPECRFLWFSDKASDQNHPGPKNVINTSNLLTFEEFLALLSCCNMIVCPDTSAMHLSEMLKIPCLVLEGSTNFSYHSKYYKFVKSIRLKKPLNCQPCYDWQLYSNCFKKNDLPWCLNNIKAKSVQKKIKEMI